MTKKEEQLRMTALSIAAGTSDGGRAPSQIVERAQAYLEFLKGTPAKKTPRKRS